MLNSRSTVDTTFNAGKLSKDSLSKHLISPSVKKCRIKASCLFCADKSYPDIKFESLIDVRVVISYELPQTFEKEKKYSYLIWVMIAVVMVLAVIVIKKIR